MILLHSPSLALRAIASLLLAGFYAGLYTAMPGYAQSRPARVPSPRATRLRPELVVQTGHIVGEVNSVIFSHDGKLALTGSSDKTARLWDIATGIELRRFTGHSDAVRSAVFSSDDRFVLTASGHYKENGDNTVRLWDARTGQSRLLMSGHTKPVTAAVMSPDSKLALSTSYDSTVRIWNLRSGKEVHRLQRDTKPVLCGAFSPNGHYAVTGGENGLAVLWDVNSGKFVRQFEGHSAPVESVAISPSGKWLLTGSDDSTARLWDMQTGKQIRPFEGHTNSIESVVFSPDEREILLGSYDNTASLWDLKTGKKLRQFVGHSMPVGSVAFAPDGHTCLTGSFDHTARLWDIQTGQELRRFTGHSDNVNFIALLSGSRQLWTGSADGSVRLWDVASGKELCRLYSFLDGSWAVTDATGRYDASHGGEIEGLHWVVGNEPIALNQLKERYYDPGLLTKYLYQTERLRDVTALTTVDLYPEILTPKQVPANGQLPIKLRNRGGGIGRVLVRLNGKEVLADARGPKPDPAQPQLSLSLPLDRYERLLSPGQQNTIEIVAYNGDGSLASRGTQILYTPTHRASARPPHFWAVVAGVSHYQKGGDLRELLFPDQDAHAIYATLQLAACDLFPDRTHLTLLNTEGDATHQPNKQNLLRELKAIAAQAKPEDVFLLYLAGHGVSYGGQEGDFYYLTSDAFTGDLKNRQIREGTALSGDEIGSLLIRIPTRKQVLILDTCASGKLIEKLSEKRAVEGSVIRSWERMKDRTGLWILAGCAADAVSYESSRYGQGVLTYSLLQGLKEDWQHVLRQDPQSRHPELVDISQLFNYAADTVPQLAQDIGGIQKPMIAARRDARPFDIGRFTDKDRVSIPLASKKVIFLRPSMELEDRPADPLGLARLLDTKLRESSSRGANSRLLFWDIPDHAGAYRIAGRYQVSGSRITAHIFLYAFQKAGDTLEEQLVGPSFSIEGDTTHLDTLISDILTGAQQRTGGSTP